MGLSVCLSVHQTFVVSMHFQTNHIGDWSQTLWMHSYSPGLINGCHAPLNSHHSLASDWFSTPWVLIGRAVSTHLQTNCLIQPELKFCGPTYYGPAQAWLTFGHTLLNSGCVLQGSLCLVEPSLHICCQTTEQMEWCNSLWVSPGLILLCSHSAEFLPFPGLQFVKQFPCIYWQTADQIELKFVRPTRCRPSMAWLTFGYAALNHRSDSPPL